eukprot:1638274-Rhodomonas_salina.1
MGHWVKRAPGGVDLAEVVLRHLPARAWPRRNPCSAPIIACVANARKRACVCGMRGDGCGA